MEAKPTVTRTPLSAPTAHPPDLLALPSSHPAPAKSVRPRQAVAAVPNSLHSRAESPSRRVRRSLSVLALSRRPLLRHLLALIHALLWLPRLFSAFASEATSAAAPQASLTSLLSGYNALSKPPRRPILASVVAVAPRLFPMDLHLTQLCSTSDRASAGSPSPPQTTTVLLP